jgi:DNA polymerase-3 subunit beta
MPLKITVQQKDLHAALAAISGVAKFGGAMPVVGYVRIDASEGGASIAATDTEILGACNLEADVATPGQILVPADTLAKIVALMPDAGISIESSEGKVLVSCLGNDYTLMTLPADEFPVWDLKPECATVTLPQPMLRWLLESTLYAVAKKDHRRVLMGVQIEIKDDLLTATATDGKLLSRVRKPVQCNGKARGIVPKAWATRATKLLSAKGGECCLVFAGEGTGQAQQVRLSIGQATLHASCIEGKYPDCDAVIPKTRDIRTRIDVAPGALAAMIRRAGTVAEDKMGAVIVDVTEGKAAFSAMTHDLGSFGGSMAVEVEGDPVKFAVNKKLALETLATFDAPSLRLRMKSATAPIIIEDPRDSDREAILMPIKLANLSPSGDESEGDDSAEATG